MNAYFIGQEHRIENLHFHAGRWVNTPFRAHSMICQAGVDCVHLAAALYIATGALMEFQPPAYSLDGGQHNSVSKVVTWMDTNPSFSRVLRLQETKTIGEGLRDCIAPGDLLCFRFNLSEHHVGVVIHGKQLIHAPAKRKVVIGTLSDPVYLRCLTAAYRPMGPGGAT